MAVEQIKSVERGLTSPKTALDIEDIQELIPHRYPMLMIERVTDIVVGESAVGIKNVSMNEPYFQGHFPGKPVMPGVLIVEAMAQTAAIVVIHSLRGEADGKLVYFMSVEKARFRRLVVPGDILKLVVEKIHQRSNVWKFSGKAFVGDKLHAEAVYTAMIDNNTPGGNA